MNSMRVYIYVSYIHIMYVNRPACIAIGIIYIPV